LSPAGSNGSGSASPRRFKELAARIRERNRKEAEDRKNPKEYRMPQNGLNIPLSKKI
jgi:hypothetical protein